MTSFEAFIFGILQGLTEFFPVSSSAHFSLLKKLLHLEGIPIYFDLFCHLGSLLALIFYVRKELYTLLLHPQKWASYILALLPLPFLYFLLKDLPFSSLTGFFWILSGLLLFWASFSATKAEKKMSDMLCIGLMQGFALLPGLSRSALTISTACLRGWELKEAVRFSFLLAIPTILGGNILEGIVHHKEFVELSLYPCFIGFLTSFLIGSLCVRIIFSLTNYASLRPFGWYCLAMGIFYLVL